MNVRQGNEVNQFILYLLIGGIVGALLMGTSSVLGIVDELIVTEDYYQLLLQLFPDVLVALALMGVTILMKKRYSMNINIQLAFFGFFILQEIVFYFGIIGPFEVWLNILLQIIFLIPFITIYRSNSEIPAVQLAFVGRILSKTCIIINMMLWAIGEGSAGAQGIPTSVFDIMKILVLIKSLFILAEATGLIFWFYIVYRDPLLLGREIILKARPLLITPPGEASPSTLSDQFYQQQRPVGSPAPPKSQQHVKPVGYQTVMKIPLIGEFKGIPIVDFWCNSCNRRIKINTRSWKEKDYETPHNCPHCNSVVRAWYRPSIGEKYKKFLFGIGLFSGGIITSLIEATFGQYSIQAASIIFPLAILELVVGIILMFTAMRMKYISQPSYATTTLPPVDHEDVKKSIIIFTVVGILGGLLFWWLNTQIASFFVSITMSPFTS